MTTTDYYTARQAQDARYENATGLPVGDTGRQEYRDYFGVGDCSSQPIERRVTYQTWLVDSRAERDTVDTVTPAEAFALSGAQLAVLALAGDWVAKDEIVRRWVKRAGVAA